ncbi:YDG domain-containing protein [Asticcacaulis sp.]|uniref:YDG domain-containing protein n=1 Tax=Asticcacaulis sp. TaxID=1872648 RepID=UPI002CA925DC|nr:YDG domain-containing protein [Asticcacaulis sp.]HTM80137.1 YDG domain-containing protein [Asticcacaulis sp.]
MQARFCAPARTRAALLTTTLLMSGILLSSQALAQTVLPSGGQVIAGAATINGSGSQTMVSQSSDKAIINWTDFSIGQGGKVTFNNGTGTTLNRVTGGNLSSIDGLLNATGSVYLINPNGVIIGKTGVVNVGGGFVASALDITNDNFLSGGDLTFSGPSLASVVNLGKIGALGGDVALMAVNVQNSGAIDAANGTAGLLAGHKIILRDSSVNDGRFLIVTGGADTTVTNDGAIAAASAELRAEGGNIYALAGNTSGVIRATGVSEKDGKVWLIAGTNGSVTMSGGTVAASAANGDGGTISVTGQTITVAADTTLDASSAAANGNGGTVKVIADMASGDLTFAGKALARAGSLGGNGGFVETSGAAVDFNGARIDTSAAAGKGGNWLIDPYNLTIDAGAATTISTNLASTNVTLQTTASGTSAIGTASSGDGDIIINSDITWASGNTLTLDAYHGITVNGNVTVAGAGGVVLTTNDGGTGGDYNFTIGNGLNYTGAGGSLTINGSPYTLLYTMGDFAALSSASGNYALATSLDASGTIYNASVVNYFYGAFDGLGHAIDNLSLNDAYGMSNVGLFGYVTGTLRDIGVTNATVTSGNMGMGMGKAGILAGLVYTAGVVKNAYTTGTISENQGGNVGGLVGISYGTINNAYSTASVINTNGSSTGGLVGGNAGGSITDAYATGAVTGGTGFTGGLVGFNEYATITNAYATGAVTATGGNAGGITGYNSSGTLTNTYFDTDTTGMTVGVQGGTLAGATGLTTAQFQNGTLPSGFGSAWSTTSGLYPYLKSFGMVTADQKISGYAYNADGTFANAATVGIWSGGASLGVSASTGANGYYYIIVAPGTATSSTALGGTLTLSGASSVSGLSYTNSPTLTGSDVTDFNIKSGLIDLTSGATSYSSLQSLLGTTFGNSTLSSALTSITNPDYRITASGAFTLGSALTGGGAVSIKTGGDLTVNSAVTVGGSKALTLDSHDNLYVNANLTASGSNAVTLKSADGGSGDYYFALGDSLSFTGSGASLNINGEAYTLLYSLSDFSSLEGSTGKFALAKSLDATASSYTASVVANFGTSSNHTGIFTGLGNTITDLKITAYYGYTGLFGFNFGTIRDIGLVGGLIQADETGSLVGFNYSGVIKNAFSSATVMGGSSAGGLVETNSGVISNSFATGAVIGGWTAGGLVAANYNGSGIISNSYATGSVYARTQGGGLAGINNGGTIINSFATGALTGTGAMGGLSGSDNGGTITNSYYDSGTTGAVNGLGTTLTTAQLQGGLPSGFSSSAWATGTGLYPYLKTFYPGGLQAITGTAQNNSGGAASAAQLAFYTGGAQLGSASSGANGYYYFVTAPGTATASTELGATLTLNGASGVSGLSYTNAPSLSGGNVVNFNITSDLIDLTTGATSYSNLQSRLTATFGNSALTSALASLTHPDYKITANGAFNFDRALTTGGGLNATAAGGIILSANLTTGGAATFNSAVTLGRDVTLTSDNALAFHSTINGAHNLTLSGTSLDFAGAVGGTSALTSLAGTATAGDITVGGRIATMGAIRLAANGSFTNTAGATALNAGGGFTVYTQDAYDPTGTMPVNSFGGLTATNYYNDAYDFGTGTFASAVPTGDHFVYAYAASLTPILSGDATRTYNATTDADTTGLTVSGTLLSDNDSVTFSIDNASYDTKNAGTDKTVTADISLSSNPNNYTLDSSTASAAVGTIDKATLVAGLTGMVEKTYDATTDASLTKVNYTLTGVFGSDDVALNDPASGRYADKNAGTGKTVSVSGLVLSGGDADNYTVNTSASGAIGTIDKATLSLAAVTGTRTYDATTTSSGTVGVYGLQGSDTVTGLSQSYDSKNAGSRTLGVNGGYVVNDGNGGSNYTITTQTASGTINKATLVADLTGMVEKTYDATTDASLTNANYTLTGVFGGDSVTLNDPASGSYADQNAGTGKTVSVSGLALSGEDAGNYTVNTSAFGAVGVIDKRSVTITADDIGKISGVNDPLLTWQMTLGSLAGNDSVSGGLSRATGENPGTYAITQGSLAASDNYTVTFIGAKFTITPAGMQNQPVVNPVQNSFAPPPPFSAFSDNSGPDSGSSGGNAGGSAPAATGPGTGDSPSSSTTCTDGGACANQPYPGNQSFSSYVSFLSY